MIKPSKLVFIIPDIPPLVNAEQEKLQALQRMKKNFSQKDANKIVLRKNIKPPVWVAFRHICFLLKSGMLTKRAERVRTAVITTAATISEAGKTP